MEKCTFSISENGNFYVTPNVKAAFDLHGFILVKQLFSNEEITNLKNHFENNVDIKKHAYGRSDGNGRLSKICLWNRAGDDLSGIISRYISWK